MKKINILFTLCLAMLLGACSDSGLDDLKGEYTPPTSLTEATAVGQPATTNDMIPGFNIFNVVINNGQGKLNLDLLGSSYFLEPGSYSAITAAQATGSRFLTETSYFDNNGQQKKIKSGTVVVERNGDDYAFSGVLWMEDGSAVKIRAYGNIHYERQYTHLTKSFDYYVMPVTGGLYKHTLHLTTAGVNCTFANHDNYTYTGSGNAAALMLITPTAELQEGDYTPADAETANPDYVANTYLKGFTFIVDFGAFQLPVPINSMYYNVTSDKADISNYFTSAKVSVEKNGAQYVITIDGDGVYAKYEGTLE